VAICRLVSADNALGDLTNSDFEQLGTICQQDILAQAYEAYHYRLCLAHIPGPANAMADLLSRRWDLDDTTILTQHDLCCYHIAVQAAMRSGLSAGRKTTAADYMRQLAAFCEQHQLDFFLRGRPDPIP
jgi:hypothetical protein